MLNNKGEVAAKGQQSISDCDVIQSYLYDYNDIVLNCPEELRYSHKKVESDYNSTFKTHRSSRKSTHTIRSQSSHISRASSVDQKSDSHTITESRTNTDASASVLSESKQ